ncbi:CoA-binding protein [Demequina sp.]|uniref:CoA-binding protein n=1 Tax=Demequina sp. TaxID=2050685 RepID=UPI003D10A7E1
MEAINDFETAACPMPTTNQAPEDAVLADLLASATSIAVVGASPNESRTSHQIATWLMDHTPYEVYLVNPAAPEGEIRGHGFYASLAELPVVPDIVDVFRREEFTPAIATESVVTGAGTLWLQLGVVNEEAMGIARGAGLTGIENRCIKVEYARLRDRIEAARAA